MSSAIKSGFSFASLPEILEESDKGVEWLVDEMLIAGGLSILVAKPKAGKSTVVKTLVMSVAHGEDFLGFATKKGRVLYLALEEHRAEFRKDFSILGADGTEEIFVHIGMAPGDAINQLRQAVESYKPVLVIVDTLLKLIRLKDGNDYVDVNEKFEPLLQLARSSGAHFLCVHHSKKGKQDDDDSILGSTAILGMVDCALYLIKSKSGRTLSSTVRYGKKIDGLALEMNADTKRIFVSGSKDEAEVRFVSNQIVQAFKAPDQTFTEKEILEMVEARTKVIKRALREAIADGRLVRSGLGRKGHPFLYCIRASGIVVPVSRMSNGNHNAFDSGSENSSLGTEPKSEQKWPSERELS